MRTQRDKVPKRRSLIVNVGDLPNEPCLRGKHHQNIQSSTLQNRCAEEYRRRRGRDHIVSVLVEFLEGCFDVRRGIQSVSTEPRMARQAFLEIEEKAVISLTLGRFWWQHPFRQPEPQHQWSRQEYAVGEDEAPHHSVAENDIDRSGRLDDLHRLVE